MYQIEEKIKVFISSKMGDTHADEKYLIARKAVKEILEGTNLFTVYLFEDKGASIMTASNHYTQALIDSDVCIFLIDNKDGVPQGVQSELDTVEKYKKPSLYYFCDQWEQKKTQAQLNLLNAHSPKHFRVVSFASFVEQCPKDLIETVLANFKNSRSLTASLENLKENSIIEDEKITDDQQFLMTNSRLVISKDNLENDLCQNYFEYLLLENNLIDINDSNRNFDFYCRKFLEVMFEENTIENFNTSLFLESLKKIVPDTYYLIIEKRWESNVKYYMSQYEESYELLLAAFDLAKKNEEIIDEWFIDDILIDLRNRENKMLEQKNKYTSKNFGQKELNKRVGKLYYPILDRNEKSLLSWIDTDRQKKDLQSYDTWSSYGNLSFVTNNIADFYYQTMMFGSLTQLSRVYTLIQKFTYHLAQTTEYWPTILMALKSTILSNDYKKVKQISKSFNEVFEKMNQDDAKNIYCFSMNNKPKEDQFISNLVAMSVIGYYLNDTDFENYWNKLKEKIIIWNEDENRIISTEPYITRCIKGIHDRLDDDFILNYSLNILSTEKNIYHNSALELISNNYVDFRKIDERNSNKTIDLLIHYVEDKSDYNEITKIQRVFILLENMSNEYKRKLKNFIQNKWPEFYIGEYKFEKNRDIVSAKILIKKLVSDINKRNAQQGKNGVFSLFGTDPYLTSLNICKAVKENISEVVLNDLFVATTETILSATQTANEKASAYRLAIYLIKDKSFLKENNPKTIESLLNLKDYDQSKESIITHIDSTINTLCHFLLLESLGKNKYKEIVETLSLFNDSARQIEGAKVLKEFLHNHENIKINKNIESLILQTVLLWSKSTSLDVRWHNVKLQLKFYELKRYRDIIGANLYSIVTLDNAFVKSQILHELGTIKKYNKKLADKISLSAENDNDFVIRKIITSKTKN